MRDFATLFTGRDDVYGKYSLASDVTPSLKGKLAGKAVTIDKPVTPELYAAHIRGEQMLGIVPIRLDGTVLWFVIDVDNYEDGLHPAIMKKINARGLPLVVTTSKSGGAHLWCFLTEPIPAAQARDVGKVFAKALDLPESIEIFPKQTSTKKDDKGSWINLPYFGNERWCVGEDGTKKLTFEEFMEYANANLASPEDLKIKRREAKEAPGGDTQAPPCLQRRAEDGVEEGQRNDTLKQYSIYAKQAFPDDWEMRVKEWNDEHVTPRYPMDELSKLLAGARRKDIHYMCNRFGDVCDKQACLKLAYGVGRGGGGEGAILIFDRIEWIDGEQPFFRVSMFDRMFQAKPEQLFNYTAFRNLCLGATGEPLPMMKQGTYEEQLTPALALKINITAPPDTQTKERIIARFKDWVSQACSRDNLGSALLRFAPYYDGAAIYFKGEDFMKNVDRVHKDLTRSQVFVILRDWGVMQTKQNDGRKTHELWMYPITEPVEWLGFEREGK